MDYKERVRDLKDALNECRERGASKIRGGMASKVELMIFLNHRGSVDDHDYELLQSVSLIYLEQLRSAVLKTLKETKKALKTGLDESSWTLVLDHIEQDLQSEPLTAMVKAGRPERR